MKALDKEKESSWVGIQIRKTLKYENFYSHSSGIEKEAWYFSKALLNIFWGNHKTGDYDEIITSLLNNDHKMGVNICISIFSFSYLNFSLKT